MVRYKQYLIIFHAKELKALSFFRSVLTFIFLSVFAIKAIILAHKKINARLDPCNNLINGANGNHSKNTTSKSFFQVEDLIENNDVKTFLNLDPESIRFVFDS